MITAFTCVGVFTLCLVFAACAPTTTSSSDSGAQPSATRPQIALATKAPTATPKPTVTPNPTATPVPPTPTFPPPPPTATSAPACVGVNGNPWCYDFNPGNLIYNPPSNFCDYFNCIASFWTYTNGYVAECNDQTFSHSGGVSGACSHHGGEWRPLYSH